MLAFALIPAVEVEENTLASARGTLLNLRRDMTEGRSGTYPSSPWLLPLVRCCSVGDLKLIKLHTTVYNSSSTAKVEIGVLGKLCARRTLRLLTVYDVTTHD